VRDPPDRVAVAFVVTRFAGQDAAFAGLGPESSPPAMMPQRSARHRPGGRAPVAPDRGAASRLRRGTRRSGAKRL